MPFGSLLRPLEAFLRGLCSQKPLKTNWFFMVFENEGFWFFEAPDGSFWFILALLGRSDPKLGSNMSFNIYLKSFNKLCKNCLKNVQFWVRKFGPKIVKNEIATLRHFLPRRHLLRFFLGDLFRAFGALWVLLGRLLGFLRVSWEVSGPKNIKNHSVF